MKKEIEDFVQAIARTDPYLRENPPRIEWILDADCGETSDTEDFFGVMKDCLEELYPEAIVEGNCAHTDMGWFCNVGIPTLNFGPGDSKLCHQSDEHIEIPSIYSVQRSLLQQSWTGACVMIQMERKDKDV